MTPQIFVAQLRSTVIDDNVATYEELFGSIAPDAASDAYWKRALALYRSLNEADRRVFFEIMRQTIVDTVSNVLGILDGVSALKGPVEDFILTSKSDGLKINGGLQDLFLEAEERKFRQ